MKATSAWTIQSFLSCFLWIAVLTVVLYYISGELIQILSQWVSPFLTPGSPDIPEDVRTAFLNLSGFLEEVGANLERVLFGLGAMVFLFLWISILFQGRGLANRAVRESVSEAGASVSEMLPRVAPARKEHPEPPPVTPEAPASPRAAIQVLSLLQREGRLIDFLQEDLGQYQDAQIGAAVRNIHQGCKAVLADLLELKPVMEETEGTEVAVGPGFSPEAVRLTGNVSGDPPFRGTLRHRGWRAVRVQLPEAVAQTRNEWIIAPAEVELV
jgi:hypothetical protein